MCHDGKCQTMNVVCDCRVTSPEPQIVYFGLEEGKWKKRYYNHKNGVASHERVWHLKETLDATPRLKCSVASFATPYSNISKKCLLCLYKKLVIVTYLRQHKQLNKRLELFCKCSHENNYLN